MDKLEIVNSWEDEYERYCNDLKYSRYDDEYDFDEDDEEDEGLVFDEY